MPPTPTSSSDLVPVIDRYRWMLAIRALMSVCIAVFVQVGTPESGGHALTAVAAGWLVLTSAWAPLAHRWRRAAIVGMTAGLLGDGIVLGACWWAFGELHGQFGLLVMLHAVAATLLASFRTGAKVAMWHALVAVLLFETAAAGRLGAPRAVPVAELAAYLGGIGLVVIATAAFAAANERELRRRRYDSEVLRTLALQLADHQPPTAIARRLTQFARNELLATRATVVAYAVRADGQAEDGHAVVTDEAGERSAAALPGEAMDRIVREVSRTAQTRLLRRLDPADDPVLARLLPEAQHLVVVPFVLEQVRGVLLLEHRRWSSQRGSKRIERRMIMTAEQATLHASMALGRAILTDRIRVAAEVDGLTNVANRRTFNEALDRAVHDAATRPFALVLVDLDHFKRLNDTYGHQAGDDVLRQAAATLRAQASDGDLPARYGGEEFAMILQRDTVAEAVEAAERLRLAVAASSTDMPVTASLGVAMCPTHARDAHALIAAADAALYEAKRGGRNRVVLAESHTVTVQPEPVTIAG